MTKKYVEAGACFEFKEHSFMLVPDSEKSIQGNLYLFVPGNAFDPILFGRYAWGLDPYVYVTREIMPGEFGTVAIWKRECKYLGKNEVYVQVQPTEAPGPAQH